MMADFPIIGDVRGKGLLLAFELVADRATMRPLPKEMNAFLRLSDIAYEKGLIIYPRRTREGVEGDHFLVCPPMIATDEHIDEILTTLHASLTAFVREKGL
nr:hypothetical protein [Kordiimonas gwangyangensis]